MTLLIIMTVVYWLFGWCYTTKVICDIVYEEELCMQWWTIPLCLVIWPVILVADMLGKL
jgi:hypothetical protein